MRPAQVARWIALPVAVLAVSTAGILIRLTTAPPLVTATHRLVWTSVLLFIVAGFFHRRDLRRLGRPSLPLLAISGALLGIHFACWTTSLFYTSVASAVLLADTHPILDTLFGRVFLGEPTSLGVWVGVLVAVAGAAIVTGGDVHAGGTALVGDLLALGASITFAGYLVIGKHARRSLGTIVYAAVVYGVAGVLTGSLALLSGTSLLDFSPRDAALWLGLILGPTLAGHTVFNWALGHLPVSVVGVAVVGEPIATTIWAALILGEPPPATALLGGAVTIIGVYLAIRASAKAEVAE